MKNENPIQEVVSKLNANQIGNVTRYAEPISCFLPIEQVRNIFENDKSLSAIPVDFQGGVTRLISRKVFNEKSKSFLLRLQNSTASDFVESNIAEFDSRENVKMILNSILKKKH
jgi:hypothetical protein